MGRRIVVRASPFRGGSVGRLSSGSRHGPNLKPGNVMIGGHGRARITDFGLAVPGENTPGAVVERGLPPGTRAAPFTRHTGPSPRIRARAGFLAPSMIPRMFRLETARLFIREWDPADRPAFRAMAQDPVVMRYINGGVPLTEEEIDAALGRQRRHAAELGFCMGALVEKASGEVVGVAGLQPLGTTGDLEIGWWLSPRVWGRGYATEAGQAAMTHVLETLGRERVVAIIDPPNEASKRVAMRLGLRLVRRTTGVELGHRLPEIVVDLFAREARETGPAAELPLA